MTTVEHAESLEPGRGRAAHAPTQIPGKGWKDILMRVWGEISDDRVTLIAAGVTYYLLLALFPALTAFVSVYGLVADPQTVTEHVQLLAGILPGGGVEIISGELQRLSSQSAGSLSVALIISILMALWSASAGVKSLFEAMNVAYDEKETRGFIKLNALALAFTLGGVIAALLMIGVVIVLPAALSFLGLGTALEWVIRIAGYLAAAAIMTLGIAALYRWGPSRQVAKWRWITPGAVLAIVVMLLVSLLFSWYVANFGNYNKTYGSLGALIGFLTWVWLSVTILVVGGELNSEIEHQTAEDSTTGPSRAMGQRGAKMADTLGRTSAGEGRDDHGYRDADGNYHEDRPHRRFSAGSLAVALPAALVLGWMQKRSRGGGR